MNYSLNYRVLRQTVISDSETGVNNYGYRMIDFCIDSYLLIINGRGNDNSGSVTCKILAQWTIFYHLHLYFQTSKVYMFMNFVSFFRYA